MSGRNYSSSNEPASRGAVRPASFPNNSINNAMFKDLSRNFKNLKVNEKKKCKRNSLTDSEASDNVVPSRTRGAGGGVVTTRTLPNKHHARALHEIRNSLEPYAASDVSRESIRLAAELNIDEAMAEKVIRDSTNVEVARERLIQILTKKMQEQAQMNYMPRTNQMMQHSVYQQGEYRYVVGKPSYLGDANSSAHRGSPDGASLRAESPVQMFGTNGMNHQGFHPNSQMAMVNQSYDRKQNNAYLDGNYNQNPRHFNTSLSMPPSTEPPAYPTNTGVYRNSESYAQNSSGGMAGIHMQQAYAVDNGLISERGGMNGQVSADIVPGHVQQIVQRMSPSMQKDDVFFKNSNTSMKTELPGTSNINMTSSSVMDRNYKPIIKGSSTSSIVQQNPAAMTASSSVGLVQTNPPSHPPPSYNVAQQFRSKQKQATQSNYALSGYSGDVYGSNRGLGHSVSRINPLPNKDQQFANSINGALMGNINLPRYQSCSSNSLSTHSSSPQSSISSNQQLEQKYQQPIDNMNYQTIQGQPQQQRSRLPSNNMGVMQQSYPQACAEPCHALYTTVAGTPILQPVSSQPVSKPQPMTAEIPGAAAHQHYPQPARPASAGYMDIQPQFSTNQNQQCHNVTEVYYRKNREPPPPYGEQAGSGNNLPQGMDMQSDIQGSVGGMHPDPRWTAYHSSETNHIYNSENAKKTIVTEKYLNVTENNKISNSSGNPQVSTSKRATGTKTTSRRDHAPPRGTESAVKAARVTASNAKRHALSYSSSTAPKQQKAGSISGTSAGLTNDSSTRPVVTASVASDENYDSGEKTIRTSPVPFRKSSKNKKSKTKDGTRGGRSSDSEEEDDTMSESSANSSQVSANPVRTRRMKRYSAEAYKFYMEQHIENIIKGCHARETRKTQLEREMTKMNLPHMEQEQMRTMLYQKESNYIRFKRGKIDSSMFIMVKPLGVGAFGRVYLAKKTSSNVLYAIKALRKQEVLTRNQVAHVKAERDILSEADNDWVVRLYYTFQDKKHLYFVMEYIPGGDMMSLLIKKGIFDEPLARFYTAELTLALESVHKMGFIHRDIKPDNILIDRDGHIKLTDFGLCTGFRWTHDSKYYQKDNHVRQDSMDFSQDWAKSGNSVKTLDRRRARDATRHVAQSLVGTPNYIAPEVLLREGYTQLCDWWSVGVILYEMVVGQPPFNANSPEETQMKVINWKNTLRFPDHPRLRHATKDIITRFCSDQRRRIGGNDINEIKSHPFFESIDWCDLRRVRAPYIPQIRHAEDTSNFDPPEADFNTLNQSRVGTLNNTPLRPGEHAFFEFTFRRFFDEDGRAISNTHYDGNDGWDQMIDEESSEDEMDASEDFQYSNDGYNARQPDGMPGGIGHDMYV